jgi:hypothetical protein
MRLSNYDPPTPSHPTLILYPFHVADTLAFYPSLSPSTSIPSAAKKKKYRHPYPSPDERKKCTYSSYPFMRKKETFRIEPCYSYASSRSGRFGYANSFFIFLSAHLLLLLPRDLDPKYHPGKFDQLRWHIIIFRRLGRDMVQECYSSPRGTKMEEEWGKNQLEAGGTSS